MARKQTRKSISMRGATYADLVAWGAARDWPVSGIAEALARALLDGRIRLVESGSEVTVDPNAHPKVTASAPLAPPASSNRPLAIPARPVAVQLPPVPPPRIPAQARPVSPAVTDRLHAEWMIATGSHAVGARPVAHRSHFTGNAPGPAPDTTPHILSREARKAREIAKKTPIPESRPGGPSSRGGDPRWGQAGHLSGHRGSTVDATRTAAALVVNRPAPVGLTPATIAQPRPLPAPPVLGLTQAPVARPCPPSPLGELADTLEPLPAAIRTARRDGHTTLLG